jgi:hypothetical protein
MNTKKLYLLVNNRQYFFVEESLAGSINFVTGDSIVDAYNNYYYGKVSLLRIQLETWKSSLYSHIQVHDVTVDTMNKLIKYELGEKLIR